MQLDGALISIERRKITGCIDLATVFVRQHFGAVALMTLVFAVPSCVLTWFLMSYVEWVNHLVILLMFALISPLLGAVLVIAAGKRVFGDQLEVGPAFRTMRGRLGLLFGYMLLTRLLGSVLWCTLIVPIVVVVRYGHLAEVLYLESTPRKKVGKRMQNLMQNVFGDLVGRGLAILTFYTAMVIGLFIVTEMLSHMFLGTAILTGRVEYSPDTFSDEFMILCLADPLFVTVVHVLMWLVYPIVRLAWFFAYLDVRIQKEGWDVELDFRIEAQRLNALT